MTKKKVLFIDRDGTLIVEPPKDFQVDSLEKLEFIPKVMLSLNQVCTKLDYELVMVTNQDGLGTSSFPEETFWLPHNKMMKALENEGIIFKEVLIDRSFPADNASTRKPETGLLEDYINDPDYDLENSFVIGDRTSDMQLAKNLNAKGIWFNDKNKKVPENLQDTIKLTTDDWTLVWKMLASIPQPRTAQVKRQTKETEIEIVLNLDKYNKPLIHTELGFFDHMLEQLAYHARINLKLHAKGDLHIDPHHTIEDTAITLGQAFKNALQSKRGIERYGFYEVVMDESFAKVALDFSGRPYLTWKADFKREKVGQMPTEMFEHFFYSWAVHAACTLRIEVEGKNEHHMIEAIFKAFARAIKMAIEVKHEELPSTKGML